MEQKSELGIELINIHLSLTDFLELLLRILCPSFFCEAILQSFPKCGPVNSNQILSFTTLEELFFPYASKLSLEQGEDVEHLLISRVENIGLNPETLFTLKQERIKLIRVSGEGQRIGNTKFVMFAICGPTGPAGPPFARATRWTSSSSCAAVMVMRLKLFVACVSGGAIVRSGVGLGLTVGSRGLVNEAKNVVAWLLCLSGLGSTAEVAPPLGSGVSSLVVKASMLLLAAWSRAQRSLRRWSASRS